MGREPKVQLLHIRLTQREYDFLKDSVDFYYCDDVSSVVRRIIRQAMRDQEAELSRRVPSETR